MASWAKLKRGGLAALLLSGSALVAVPMIAMVPTEARAQAQAPVAFAINPQSLDGALAAFGAASGIQVLYDAGVANGVRSPGVSGSMDPQEALSRLLAGTGFAPRFTGPKSVTIQKMAAANSGTTTLAPLTLEGRRQESPVGPDQGIIASRSATATKTDTALIDTPQSVSVVTRDAMTAQGARTVDAATRYTSGIRSERFGTDTRHDWFAIRGIHATSDGGFLDGHSMFATGFAGTRIEEFGLERIEVVKGPNSAMYGGAPAGGFVNMVSKRPQFENGYEVQTGVDNFGQFYAGADATGAVDASGKLAYRLIALGRAGEVEGDGAKDERFFIAPSLTWRPTDDTTLTVLASYQKDHTGPKLKPTFLPYVGTVDPIPGYGHIDRDFNFGEDSLDGFDRDQIMLGYDFEHKVNDQLTLRQSTKYTYLDVSYGLTYSMPNGGTGTTFNRLWGLSKPESHQVSVDNSAIFKAQTGSVNHTFLGGFDYRYYQTDNYDEFGFPAALDVANPDYDPPAFGRFAYNDNTQKLNQYGVYLQDEMNLDRWYLTLSGRHDWVTLEQNSPTGMDPNLDRKDSSFSGRAALLYKTSIGLSPYVSYSTFFNPVVGENSTGGLYKPETGRQYELGVKFQPEGSRTMITAAVFDIVRENVVSSNVAPFNGRQDDEVRSRGFEIEGSSEIVDGLNLRGAFTYHDLKILEGSNKGERPVSAPELYASAWADYTFQTGDLRGLGFGAGVRYVGDSPANDQNSRYVPDYALADAAIFYDIQGWRLGLNVSNLFDKRYVAACTGTTHGNEYCYWGEGRRAMLNASYKW
ncbi:TonB-dependent siderophore receptor [Lacibacterium aquatile]|uniref:TonB-dependent siderophore receptor n=1 Tax=Lacibacterium aquatile TaxID=1168082 RepID=A0ABW5DVJ2_9PROT